MPEVVADSVVSLAACRRFPPRALFARLPQLHDIWHPDLSVVAAVHTQQWETDPGESGQIYLAKADDGVVGVTGWYRMSTTEAGLRWHGVLPGLRGRGFSRQMLAAVCARLPHEVRHVFEVTRNPDSRASFERCGFDVVTEPAVVQRAVDDAAYDINGGGWVLRKALARD